MLSFYGFHEQPFGTTPNPRFLFLSDSHRRARALLTLGIENQFGFAAIFAEPGMGKTTLLFDLLTKYRNKSHAAFVFTTQCDSLQLLRYIATDLQIPGVEGEQDPVCLHHKFGKFVAENTRTRPVLIIIDEAQNLDPSALETVRLLSDFETPDRKLLHIIIAGQPRLAETLRHPALSQLLQRITNIARLSPLSREETSSYIDHRLCAAGYTGPTLFTEEALGRIAAESKGIPRAINRLCLNSLQLGSATKLNRIGIDVVDEVVAEFDLNRDPAKREYLHLDVLAAATPSGTEEAPQGELTALPKQTLTRAAAVVPSPEVRSVVRETARPASFASRQHTTPLVQRTAERSAAPPPIAKPLHTNLWVAALVATLAIIALVLVKLPTVKSYVRGMGEPRLTAPQPDNQGLSAPARPVSRPVRDAIAPDASATKKDTVSVATNPTKSADSVNDAEEERTIRQARPRLASESTESSIVSLPRQNFAQGATKASTLSIYPTRKRAKAEAEVAAPQSGSVSPMQIGAVSKIISIQTSALPRMAMSSMATASPSRVESGTPIHLIQPVYPSIAKASHIWGEVLLAVDVSANGTVDGVQVLRGNSLLAEAAKRAVQQWRYRPSLLNGNAIPAQYRVTITFNDRADNEAP